MDDLIEIDSAERRRNVSLSEEFCLCVMNALNDLGFDSTYELPGYIAIHTRVFEFRTGQHAWSYCTIDVRYPDHQTGDEEFSPLDNSEIWSDPGPQPSLNEYETDPFLIAETWARAIRAWMEKQNVRRELIP